MEIKENYYWLTTDNSATSVAYAPKSSLHAWELIPMMNERENLPFELEVRRIIIKESLQTLGVTDDVVDYQPNSLAWPLMSQRMKDVICSDLSGHESIIWKTAILKGSTCEFRYYVPMFTKHMDIIDLEKSIIVPSSGVVLKPVFIKERLEPYSMFHGPNFDWQISTSIFVNEVIKKSLQMADVKGIAFSKACVINARTI